MCEKKVVHTLISSGSIVELCPVVCSCIVRAAND